MGHFVPVIGEVYMMHFRGDNNIQDGYRPGIVLQNALGNKNSPNIIAIPLTAKLKHKEMPTHIIISAQSSGLQRDSLALCENPSTISKSDVGRYITTLSFAQMRQISAAHLIATGTVSFLSCEDFLKIKNTVQAMTA